MNIKNVFNHEKLDRVVYVRAVNVSDLPTELRAQVPETERVYAIHFKDGEQLAFAKSRQAAFAIARTNEFEPFSAHWLRVSGILTGALKALSVVEEL